MNKEELFNLFLDFLNENANGEDVSPVAVATRQLYEDFIKVGFTPEQSFELIKNYL